MAFAQALGAVIAQVVNFFTCFFLNIYFFDVIYFAFFLLKAPNLISWPICNSFGVM
jgi:hypothetical protein